MVTEELLFLMYLSKEKNLEICIEQKFLEIFMKKLFANTLNAFLDNVFLINISAIEGQGILHLI